RIHQVNSNNAIRSLHDQPPFACAHVTLNLVVIVQVVNQHVLQPRTFDFSDIYDSIRKVLYERLFRNQQPDLAGAEFEEKPLIRDAAIRRDVKVNETTNAAED